MRVGFIGLGAMGAGMAHRLLDAGYDLTVHDLDRKRGAEFEEKGARWASSIAELGAGNDVVLTSLPGPVQMRAVGLDVGGLLESMTTGSTWFDLTTNAASTVREVALAAEERGIHLLDAPVSGRPLGAREGKLALYVGGPAEIFREHQALLDTLGDRVMHMGDTGSGNVTKIVHNCASISIRAAIAEAMTLGVKAGVEPRHLWHALRNSATGRSRTFDSIGKRYLQEAYDPPSFALNLANKDLNLALQLGEECDVPLATARVALADYDEALARGWGNLDSQAPMQLQNERAGVRLALSEQDVLEILEQE